MVQNLLVVAFSFVFLFVFLLLWGMRMSLALIAILVGITHIKHQRNFGSPKLHGLMLSNRFALIKTFFFCTKWIKNSTQWHDFNFNYCSFFFFAKTYCFFSCLLSYPEKPFTISEAGAGAIYEWKNNTDPAIRWSQK